jgi:prepilin-type N-terminal cleavage/methylation domain-containing protein
MNNFKYSFSAGVKGFTLIEIAIVLVIIFILSGIAIPVFSTLIPNYRLRSAAQELYSDFQAAKMDAIKKNNTSTLTFYPANGRYKKADGLIVDFNQEYNGAVLYGRPDPGSSVTYSGSPYPQITFNARGMTENHSAGSVFLKNKKGNYYQVGTYTSGVIILKKWNGSGWD